MIHTEILEKLKIKGKKIKRVTIPQEDKGKSQDSEQHLQLSQNAQHPRLNQW